MYTERGDSVDGITKKDFLLLKKKVTDLEEEVENQSLMVNLLLEFARSVANKDKK